MALVIPQVGLLEQIEIYRSEWNSNNLELRLFKNNYTPVVGSVLGDFTEADFSGYAAQDILVWGAPTWSSPRAVIQATAPLTFVNSTGIVGNSIYGYYVLDTGGNLIFAERDPSAPIDMTLAGRAYIITPRYSVRSEF